MTKQLLEFILGGEIAVNPDIRIRDSVLTYLDECDCYVDKNVYELVGLCKTKTAKLGFLLSSHSEEDGNGYCAVCPVQTPTRMVKSTYRANEYTAVLKAAQWVLDNQPPK